MLTVQIYINVKGRAQTTMSAMMPAAPVVGDVITIEPDGIMVVRDRSWSRRVVLGHEQWNLAIEVGPPDGE